MRALWLVVVVAVLVGCGKYGSGKVPAIGTVTLDGTPLANVYVTFRPDDGEPGNGGFAVTDSNGRFEIYYPDTGKGLTPSRYKVTITPPPKGAAPEGAPKVASLKTGGKAEAGSYPTVYSSPENTPLRVTVGTGGEALKVELLSNPPPAPKK